MVVRLSRVKGLEGRRNDVLFVPAARRGGAGGRGGGAAGAARALVFWGGDVQDYPEVMQAHRDNRHYVKWNLENTARILSQGFPDHHVVVVRPSRVEYSSFSCFDNFVPSTEAGVPEHAPSHGALRHLHRLLQEVSNEVKKIPEEDLLAGLEAAASPEDVAESHTAPAQTEHASNSNGTAGARARSPLEPEEDSRLWWRESLALQDARLTLCGFSKGCVVLNQLLYEFHYTHTLTPADVTAARFISSIEAMYWLDGGHAGGRNTWLTSRCLLATLARLDMQVFVHVSPYQVQDETRPWIGREERAFTAMLRQLGANIQRYFHPGPGAGAGAPPTLRSHFAVVADFRRAQRAAAVAAASAPATASAPASNDRAFATASAPASASTARASVSTSASAPAPATASSSAAPASATACNGRASASASAPANAPAPASASTAYAPAHASTSAADPASTSAADPASSSAAAPASSSASTACDPAPATASASAPAPAAPHAPTGGGTQTN